jgi:hypothetical protein
MKARVISFLSLVATCCGSVLTYEFHAFSRADVEAAREELPAIAVPRLLHCAQFGLYGGVDASPSERQLALSILRRRGDFAGWFHDQFRPHLRPGFEYRETRYGGRMKFAKFEGIDPQRSNDACVELFRMLEMIGTYESLMVALEYSDDERHFMELGDDYGSPSISDRAMGCVAAIVLRLGVDARPVDLAPKSWRDWIHRNKTTLQEKSRNIQK